MHFAEESDSDTRVHFSDYIILRLLFGLHFFSLKVALLNYVALLNLFSGLSLLSSRSFDTNPLVGPVFNYKEIN